MDLIKVFQRFPDHASCIEHLERVRWPHVPACPLCGAVNVVRKAENDRIGRWNCHGCKSSFNVLSGTIFQKTKIDLQKWFLAISLILERQEKPVVPPASPRPRSEPQDRLVHGDADTAGDGGRGNAAIRHRRGGRSLRRRQAP
jgi:ribosomal protein L37AE/L43A